ncbi:MAG: hypothetical protein M3R24_12525 [Chloroflexota bacterium]|nr:hypothetical protein [Chloroflexota bacterium]
MTPGFALPADLQARRLERWQQTPTTRIPDADAAALLIKRLGLVTLYAVSPEIPNLFHAYVGDPQAKPAAEWESPSGEVYGWRWALGRQEAAFYTAIVRSRPTWVSWTLLPALLRLRGTLQTPEELYRAGELSDNAQRVAQALAASGGVLSTGELRQQAGFPTGKSQRAAYLKAVEELDTRLMLAKVFAQDDTDMRHALVATRYPDAVAAAEALTMDAALDQLLQVYLPAAVYAAPVVLAKHVKLPERLLQARLERLVETGTVTAMPLPGYKGTCYVWQG